MRWLVRCVALAALAGGVLVTPARAAQGDIVLRGSRTAWIDVELPGGRDVRLYDVQITSGGRFAGFYAEQLSSTIDPQYDGQTAGVVVLRAVRAGGSDPQIHFGSRLALTTGVIRFYLIADGTTTVTIRAGLPRDALVLRPRNRVAAHAVATPLRRSGDVWSATADLPVPKRSAAVAALVAEGTLAGTGDPEVCIAERRAACPESALGPVWERIGGPQLDGVGRWYVAYLPGGLRGGRRHARFALAETTDVTRVTGAAFTLTLA